MIYYMIFFIVTTSLIDKEFLIRKTQYVNGINKLKQVIHYLNITDYKIIIVENNGIRNTFLDTSGCDIYYTRNNFLKTNNKGYKELKDIRDCIHKFNINDNDFIVKMTGRYILNDDSEFMHIIKNIHNTKYECVIRYGPYYKPVDYKMDDCITGLIGMSCVYVKQIERPDGDDSVEWKWGKVTKKIDDSKICLLNKLGINICPASNSYFMA